MPDKNRFIESFRKSFDELGLNYEDHTAWVELHWINLTLEGSTLASVVRNMDELPTAKAQVERAWKAANQ